MLRQLPEAFFAIAYQQSLLLYPVTKKRHPHEHRQREQKHRAQNRQSMLANPPPESVQDNDIGGRLLQ